MKILWIANMVLPKVAQELGLKTSFSGSWLEDYSNLLAADPSVELAIMTYANVSENIDKQVCGMRNFIFAGGGKRLLFSNPKTVKDCAKVVNDFKPDLIHIHGTEYAIGEAVVRLNLDVPILLTIQGVLTRISEEYYGGLVLRERMKTLTVKNLLKLKSLFFSKQLMSRNAKREQYILRNVKHVTGRTEWDKAVMLSINERLKYYRLNYNLRDVFYHAPRWNIEGIERYTIYTGAAGYPLKGAHILLRAVAIVKQQYPDVCLKIPGFNGNQKTANGYQRYLLRLIKELDIESNVCFLGRQSGAEVADILSKTHICVIPSAMEGASATMREAMAIGTPGICAYRGGMTDLLCDGVSGFYYDFKEYGVLASRILRLFDDDELSMQFSARAMKAAESRHDREQNYRQLIELYTELTQENKDV